MTSPASDRATGTPESEPLICPECKHGNRLNGKIVHAYGCSFGNNAVSQQVSSSIGSATRNQAELVADAAPTPEADAWEIRYSGQRHWTTFSRTLERQRDDALTRLRELEELHRMQMAGICIASCQNTRDSIKERIGRDNPYWSPAYGDMCVTVDREIRERERAEAAEGRLREKSAAYEELIMAVGNKYEGESRHQTALRYIVRAENQPSGLAAKSEVLP